MSRVLPALEVAMRREPPAIRVGVIDVLARLAVPGAVPLVIRGADDEDDEVRREAILALGRLGDRRGAESV